MKKIAFSEMEGYMFVLIQLLSWTISCYGNKQLIIDSPSGKLEGIVQNFRGKTVHTFLGIPFAKPPLGPLRFKKPVSIEPWTGILNATEMGPDCIPCLPSGKGAGWGTDISEDCLHLNIWVPVNGSNAENKSVLLFLYGGAFQIGSTRKDSYHGIALAALGDIIVVTANYRVGPQGFLYSETDTIPGNMGLYDMLESMKWVRNNIKSFGGNMEDLTVWGQSAGAIAISIFMTSPLGKGLFNRVILDSGSAIDFDGENRTVIYDVSDSLVRNVGCLKPGESLKNNVGSAMECLEGISSRTLCDGYPIVSSKLNGVLYPRTGDEIFPVNSRKLYREGDFEAYDMFIGTNRDEGSTTVVNKFTNVFGQFGQKYPQINVTFGKYIVTSYFKDFSQFLSPEKIADYYFKDITNSASMTTIFRQAQKAIGDFERICPSVYLAEVNAEKGKSVYYYKYDHYSSNSPYAPYMGVVHALELPYVFGYPLRYPQNYTQAEIALSRFMIDTWAGFAKQGKPPLQTWPLYNKSTHLLVELNANRPSPVIVGRHIKNCDMFRPIFGF